MNKKKIILCTALALIIAVVITAFNGAFAATGTSVKGDINCDGKLTSVDYRLLEKYVVSYDMSSVSAFDLSKCDYTDDGEIDIYDLREIADDASDMGTHSPRY